jgi:hypothetical protein
MYRCEAASLAGFIQQLAARYVASGYFFYVVGRVPAGKDASRVDAKLLARYGVDCSKFARARRKRAGKANVHYLRYRDVFVLLATHGEHPFFESEGGQVRDVRRVPLKVEGYAVAFRGGRVSVRIERGEYRALRAYFAAAAVRRSAAALADELGSLPYEPYAPVRRQLLGLLSLVNRGRKAAGLEEVPLACLRLRRRIGPVFTPGPTAPEAVTAADGMPSASPARPPSAPGRRRAGGG